MPLLQLVETILFIYLLIVGGVALTIYVVGVCVRFVREGRKQRGQ